jgi:hypothetical protein
MREADGFPLYRDTKMRITYYPEERSIRGGCETVVHVPYKSNMTLESLVRNPLRVFKLQDLYIDEFPGAEVFPLSPEFLKTLKSRYEVRIMRIRNMLYTAHPQLPKQITTLDGGFFYTPHDSVTSQR